MSNFDLYVCGSTEENAEEALLALMCGISQDSYCSGWNKGIEETLWNIAPGTSCGQIIVTERIATLLRLLAEEAGGWWTWKSDTDGPVFETRSFT